MKYASICSGVGSDHLAFSPLGWECAFFSEIEKFPSAVLAHHWPDTPNLGDFTEIDPDENESIRLVIGGTPCQSFSVAGKRGGMDDERGVLALEHVRLARALGAPWILWENVPGVFSANGGRDFARFLRALEEYGYGWAYRVLDAQHFGVPQRRRRVFLVGYSGDWRPAAAVLFERPGVRRDPPTRRKAGKEVTSTLRGGSQSRGWSIGAEQAAGGQLVAHTITSSISHRGDGCDNLVIMAHGQGRAETVRDGDPSHTFSAPSIGYWKEDDQATTITRNSGRTGETQMPAMVMCSGPIVFDTTQLTSPSNRANPRAGDPSHALSATGHPPAIAFSIRGREGGSQAEVTGDVAGALRSSQGGSSRPYVATTRVRRLTPRECERLQGLPDDHTRIPWRDKPADQCPDGPRYRAIGNGFAVPVVAWIGRRIQMVEEVL